METEKFMLLVECTVLKYRLFQNWEEFGYSCFLKATGSESNLRERERDAYIYRKRDISLEQKYSIFVMF